MGNHRRHLQQPVSGISLPIQTDDGVFVAIYSSLGLRELRFPGDAPARLTTGPIRGHILEWHKLTAAAVNTILAGKNPGLLPPLYVAEHSEFRQAVWAEMRTLRSGETVSYRELADRLGMPGGARSIGNACGANPIPLLIPCHRVLASGGLLGGFSGGLKWKRKLLEREGITAGKGRARNVYGKDF